MMPHIISDREYRELTAYRSSGLTPKKVLDMLSDEAAPLPLPLWADDENDIPITNVEVNTDRSKTNEHQIQY